VTVAVCETARSVASVNRASNAFLAVLQKYDGGDGAQLRKCIV